MGTQNRALRLTAMTAVSLLLAGAIAHPCWAAPAAAPDAAKSRPATDDWSQAGYPGAIPYASAPVVEVAAHGAIANDGVDDTTALQAAIDAAPENGVVLLGSGTYRISSVLSLGSGVVLRGQGAETTHLQCLNASGCLRIQGSYAGSFVNVTAGLAKGSTLLTVADATGFAVNGGGELQLQDDIVPPWASWGEDSVGQMVTIVAINGNVLTITPALHTYYDPSYSPQIRPISFVSEVGVEDLHLERISSGSSSDDSNLTITRAANCWVARIDSDNTEKYHIAVSQSLHLEIRDSYIHDAESKGDGGEGYGVSLARHVTSVLVENNIFAELRHAMILQLGTNGCVFGYNYSRRNYSDDGWDKASISLHGHYPFANLFEGNVTGFPYLGDYWGEIGPDNTLFRNWAVGTDKHQDFGEYRGIGVCYFSGPQYITGNEVTGNDGIFFGDPNPTYGNLGDPDDVVIHGNNVIGEGVTWDPAYSQTLPASYYLAGKPSFFGSLAWPAFGPEMTLGTGTIPALERWEQGSYVPEFQQIFADGFETGNTTRWSASTP